MDPVEGSKERRPAEAYAEYFEKEHWGPLPLRRLLPRCCKSQRPPFHSVLQPILRATTPFLGMSPPQS
eukprot:9675387-Alexandrium_andersonii.AAC.1